MFVPLGRLGWVFSCRQRRSARLIFGWRLVRRIQGRVRAADMVGYDQLDLAADSGRRGQFFCVSDCREFLAEIERVWYPVVT